MAYDSGNDVELQAEVDDLVGEYPDVELSDLAVGLELGATSYENGPIRALMVAAELWRRAALTKH